MKLNKLFITAAAVLLMLTGCQKTADEPVNDVSTLYVNTIDASVRVNAQGSVEKDSQVLSPITVDIFYEPACGACLMYGDITREALLTEVKNGYVDIVYHPVTFFSSQSPDAYSMRSSAYALAVAEYAPEHALTYFEHIVSMDNAPQTDSEGLVSDEVFVNIMKEVGLNTAEIALVEENKTEFVNMLNKNTEQYLNVKHPLQIASLGKNGEAYTPLVIVNKTGQTVNPPQDLSGGTPDIIADQLVQAINNLK